MRFDDWNNDELYHHGIKGQKWGIRRTAQQLGHIYQKVKEKRYGLKKGEKLTQFRKSQVLQYGRKGADRIERDIKNGISRKKATKKEQWRPQQILRKTIYSTVYLALYDQIFNGGFMRKEFMNDVNYFLSKKAAQRAKEFARRESFMKLPMETINAYVVNSKEYSIR